MQIRIQVMANQARQAIQQVQGDISKLSAAQAAGASRTAGAAAGLDGLSRSLIKSGSQMQWAGRQMTYNFTLPIIAATAAGVKFANDNAKAMTELVKVYGDGTMPMKQIKSETDALGRSFEALSEIYGVARSDVINIGAAWASAGSSGLALAKQTKITMDAMVLGNLSAADATKALIAIQAQYGQSADQLQYTIAQLNAIENQTGTTMGDLIQSMARSSGVARAAGVDVAHLAAMTAALVPAAGSASTAGNALKTIISRLLAPTKDAQDLLHAMGINMADVSWKSTDASGRLLILSKHFENLSDAQKQVVSSAIASRLQLNKFDVLMAALANHSSYYYKALQAVGDGMDAQAARTKVMKIYQQELNTVLDSSPNKFAKMKVMLENTLADAIQPLLPAITGLGMAITSIAKSFNNLSPNIQKDIIVFALLLAAVGPIVRYMGALKVLLGYVGPALIFLTKPLISVATLLWDVVSAIAAFTFDAVIGGLSLLTAAFIRVSAVMLSPFAAAWGYVSRIAVLAMGGMIAAVRTSLLVGLTSVTSLIYGAFSVLFVGLADIIATSKIGKLWLLLLQGIGRLTAVFGPTLAAIWTIIGTTLEVITVEIGSGLARAWAFIMTMIENVMVMGARALGIVWRAAMVALEVITAEAGAGIAGIWRALQALLVTIQVAGGALLRGAAAAGMAAFEGILLATASVVGAIWRGLQAALVAIQVVGMRLLTMATVAGGRVLETVWAAVSMGLQGLWKFTWSGMVGIAKGGWGLLVRLFSAGGPMLMKAFTNPWVLAALAVVALLFIFRDKLKGIWDNIVRFFQNMAGAIVQAFDMLPKGVQNAIVAVVNMVRSAALAVYHWFSYLNPFAHHSPSLVENVTNGMNVVTAQFGRLTSIKGPIDQAYASIKQFKNAALDLAKGYDSIKTANEVADLSKAGASSALISSYINLAAQLSNLKNIQDQYDNAIKAQQGVVDGWQRSLDAANKTLDAQKNKLSDLQNVAQGYQNQITALKDHLSTLTNTPIKGMQAFDDAIFANQMAQKRLQLQMDQLQQTGKGAFSSIADEAAALQGQIETVMGNRNNARSMGAGSEILGKYDDQIKALKAQRGALGSSSDSVGALQKQMDALQKQADILDLQKSLQFDGLTRQIDQAANSMKELPFDQILAGVLQDKQGISDLTDKYNAANDAVARQQAVVDAAQKKVDAVQVSYDASNQKLSDLKNSYDAVTQAIQDMNQAMSDVNAAAAGLKQAKAPKLSPTMQNFQDAAGGNFADVGGTGMVGREGGPGDQSAQIDAWTKDLQKKMGGAFGGFDMFGPFKDMWKGFVKWWDGTAWPFLKKLGKPFTHLFDGVDLGGTLSKIFGGIDFEGILSKAWSVLTSWWSTIWDIGKFLWSLIGPDVKNILGQLGDFFKSIWSSLGDLFSGLKERIGPFLDAIRNIIKIIKPVIEFFAGVFVVAIKAAFDLLVNIIKPVLDFIKTSFHNFVQFILGILDIFIGLFTGNWGKMWKGIKEVLGAIWGQIVAVVKLALGLLWAPIKTVLGWIGDLFSWLWKVAIKPVLGWIEDGWNALTSAFKWFWEHVLKPVWNAVAGAANWLWTNILKPVFTYIGSLWQSLLNDIKWAWDNVLHPVWNAIKDVANWLYKTILKPIFDAIGSVWNGLAAGFKWVWDHLLHPVFKTFSDVISAVHDGFKTAVDGIGKIWDGLKSALGKPVQWVVDFVWNNGLRNLWNWINNIWGGKDLAPFKLGFAAGGVMPGYTPGRDVHKFVSPTGGLLELSGGEAILRPEFTKALGPDWVHAANAAARSGGPNAVLQFLLASVGGGIQSHAAGGIVGLGSRTLDWINTNPIARFLTSMSPAGGIINLITDYVSKERKYTSNHGNTGIDASLGDMARDGANNIWNWIKHAATGWVAPGGGGYADYKAEIAKRAADNANALANVNLPDLSQGVTGSLAKAGAAAAVRMVANQYGWGSGAEWNALAWIISHESGFNPYAQNPTSTAYGLFQFLNSTWAGVGGHKTSDPVLQAQYGLRYIHGRYGDPIGAQRFWAANHWYDQGGLWPSGTVGINMSGGAERVLTTAQTASFEKLVNVLDHIDLVKLDARLNGSVQASQPVVYNYNGDTVTINITGDLLFPSINNGRDAETFLTNLRDMAGGSRR